MSQSSIGSRVLAALLLAALASAALAPAALAHHGRTRNGHGRPARHAAVHVTYHAPCFVHGHPQPGALAGFLGGLVVGSVLSNACPPPPPPPAYQYYDPYCRRYFVTVGVYGEHLARHRHPRSLEVFDVRGGRCLDTLEWRDGRWCSRNDAPGHEDWDD